MRALAFAALLGLASLTPEFARAQAQQDFTLANRTGYQINEVYVSPANVEQWGDDLLGANVLPDGQDLNVRFQSGTQECIFDISVTYEDQEEAEFKGVNLCQIAKVTLFYDRQARTTRFVAE